MVRIGRLTLARDPRGDFIPSPGAHIALRPVGTTIPYRF